MQAVIFDRDNTLLRFDPPAIARLERQIHAIAPTIPAGATTVAWQTWPGGWPTAVAEEPAFWRVFWRAFAQRHALSERQEAAMQAIGGFYHTCFVAFPDAQLCIERLYARGLRLAILTNFELPSIALTLQTAGLDPRHFTALLSSAMIGASKPDRRAYYAAAQALDVAPKDCLFVDDLPENVAAACAIGMRGVLLDRQSAGAPGTTWISGLQQLDALLA